MTWEKPSFCDIAMNAEIGAYQDDFDDGDIPVIEPADRPRLNSQEE
jgi:hypothetical protein